MASLLKIMRITWNLNQKIHLAPNLTYLKAKGKEVNLSSIPIEIQIMLNPYLRRATLRLPNPLL